MQVPLSSSQFALLLPKNALLFPVLPFYFPELPLYFPELPVYFSEGPFSFLGLPFCFPKVPFYFALLFYFSKIPSFPKKIQNCSLVFQKYLLFIYCVRLFPRVFFFPDFIFSSPCTEVLKEMIFALLLFCFHLELCIRQLMMP